MSILMDRPGLFGWIADMSFAQLFLSFILFLVARFVVKGIYRVYFHPLSIFPGPKSHAFTRIPQMISLWKGEPHKRVEAIHAKYGRVVRVAPDEVSYIDAEAWKYVHGPGNPKAKGSMPSKHWNRAGNSVTDTPSLLTAPDSAHSRMREVLHTAFSNNSVKLQEPLMVKHIDLLREKIHEKIPDGAIDVAKTISCTTFDLMGDLALGESLHMVNSGEYSHWISATFDSLKSFTVLGMTQYYAISRHSVRFILSLVAMSRQKHFQYVVDKVTKRIDQGRETKGHDLWTLILNKEGQAYAVSRGEIFANANLFMMAGAETTATASAGLAYLMCKNPDVYAKFVKGVREKFSSQDEITIENVQDISYLNACLKEALRLYPPVSNAQPMLTPCDGTTVMGDWIPPNTVISIPQYAMYRSETNFKDALKFAPERWLGDERYIGDDKRAFEPFHVGPRDCLGKNMAWHQLRLIAAKIHHQFDFELCAESNNWMDQKVYMVNQKGPLWMRVKARY